MLSRRTTPRRREGRRNSRSVEEGVLEVWSLERIKCGGSVWTNNDTINNQHDFASKVLRSPTGPCYSMIGCFFAFLTFPSKLTIVFGKHCSSKRSPLISDKQWGQNCPLIMLLPLLLLQLSGFLPIQGFTDCSVGSQPCWGFFAKITCRSFFWAVAVVTTMPHLSNSTLGLRTNVLCQNMSILQLQIQYLTNRYTIHTFQLDTF